MTGRSDQVEIDRLFAEYAQTRSRVLRNRLVEEHLGFGILIARRYASRGIADDDLHQVAMLALVKSVERFDHTRGIAFTTFAGRTVEGEIKRHFRDASWTLRVPRSAKEMHLAVRRAADELTQQLGHSPTVKELAAHLDVDPDDVLSGLAVSAAHSPETIEITSDESAADRQSSLGVIDPGYGLLEDRTVAEELVARLPEREREIVRMRFYENLTQSEIADRVGISQMHVSRLLRRSFETLRAAASASARREIV